MKSSTWPWKARALIPKRGALFLAAALLTRGAAAFPLSPDLYRKAFASNCAEAAAWTRELGPLLTEALGDPFLARVGMAVVYPELTRYSYIRDVAETTALELSYILGGTADFSIGVLQMKPSFAKRLEADADEEDRARFPELFRAGANEQAGRGLRIVRLKDKRRQVEYLAVFLRLMARRFSALAGDGEAMVRLFSAAYNSGYWKPDAELEAAGRLYFFPYGKLGKGEQYCYTEIALDYYRSER